MAKKLFLKRFTLSTAVPGTARHHKRAGPDLRSYRARDGGSGLLIDHAAGLACALSPAAGASSYSCEMSLFV